MNYLSYPYISAEHLAIQCVGTDVATKHALITEKGDAWQVYTTVQDFAKVVALAIDFEGKWPEVGGVVGSRVREKDYIELMDRYTGRFIAGNIGLCGSGPITRTL